jgi:iron complex outermembrane receptor protein
VADLRIGASDLRLGRVAVAPFLGVSNIFDTRYNTSVVVNAFGGRFYEPGPGRALYAGVEVRL